jgi:hypothetical protein
MGYKLKIFEYADEAAATPLHDGTNTAGQPPKLAENIVIQADSNVRFGGPDVTSSVGLLAKKNETTNIATVLSRGTNKSYDLSQIYYVGGSFQLTVEVRV